MTSEQEAAKSGIIQNLSEAEEDKLQSVHAEDYQGLDDDMPEAYERWLVDLSYQELVDILEE